MRRKQQATIAPNPFTLQKYRTKNLQIKRIMRNFATEINKIVS